MEYIAKKLTVEIPHSQKELRSSLEIRFVVAGLATLEIDQAAHGF